METITSKDNDRLKALRRLFTHKAARYESGSFPTEGLRLTREAARLGCRLIALFVGEGAIARYSDDIAAIASHAEAAFKLPDALMDKLGETQTPQGVIGVFAMPKPVAPPVTGGALMLCHLQEPGNVGAILRTANAFGLPVVLTVDCPDPYSPKVLRASMGGALSGIWSVVESAEHYITACKAAGSPVWAAVLRGDSVPVAEAPIGDGLVLLGNEGAGLPDTLIALADRGLHIPIRQEAESLGVAMAAGIVAYEMTRGGLLRG